LNGAGIYSTYLARNEKNRYVSLSYRFGGDTAWKDFMVRLTAYVAIASTGAL
jgi:hypothetical protein